ncbi:MAG: hypothetical protein V3575_06315 [Candidatus Absconditabacteria bacterium]
MKIIYFEYNVIHFVFIIFRIMRKILFGIFLFLSIGFTSAGKVARFQLVVTPNPVRVSQAVDITINALDSSGKIVTDYIGDVYIDEVGGGLKSAGKISFPDNQIISFWSTDKGVKQLEGQLKISLEGTYKIAVYDIVDDTINGSVQLKVVGPNDLIQGEMKILVPKNDNSYTGNSLPIQGLSLLNNKQIVAYINGKQIGTFTTSSNGTFNHNLENVPTGKFELYLIGISNGEIVGQSQKIIGHFTSTAPYKIKLNSLQKYKITLMFADLKRSAYNRSGGDELKLKNLYILMYKKLFDVSKTANGQKYKDEIYGLMSLIKNTYTGIK